MPPLPLSLVWGAKRTWRNTLPTTWKMRKGGKPNRQDESGRATKGKTQTRWKVESLTTRNLPAAGNGRSTSACGCQRSQVGLDFELRIDQHHYRSSLWKWNDVGSVICCTTGHSVSIWCGKSKKKHLQKKTSKKLDWHIFLLWCVIVLHKMSNQVPSSGNSEHSDLCNP